VWEREPSLTAIVEEAWSRRVGVRDLGDICSSLRLVMGSLYDLRKHHFKPVSKEIDSKQKKLEALTALTDDESERARKQLQCEMDELLYREELMWLQRSQAAWLREGDINTQYFHRKDSWRRNKNRINKLDGRMVRGQKTMRRWVIWQIPSSTSCIHEMIALIQLNY
jgi:hypothetical protein